MILTDLGCISEKVSWWYTSLEKTRNRAVSVSILELVEFVWKNYNPYEYSKYSQNFTIVVSVNGGVLKEKQQSQQLKTQINRRSYTEIKKISKS